MLFSYILERLIQKGTLRLITADGRSRTIGAGTPRCAIKLHRKNLEWSLGWDPELKIGEAYMNGLLTIEEGTLNDFIELLFMNYRDAKGQIFFRWLARLNGRIALLRQFNPLHRARKNVAYHYDLPDELYGFFLDQDRQYSCAYFTDRNNSLEQAQFDKKCHIASKLLLTRPGLKVLDIGCGWGGLGLYLASETGSNVTGITLSAKQYRAAQQRAKAARLEKTCRFELRDYRQGSGLYDRIVSVGMFEHVGKKNYDEFFAHIRNMLTEDGVCLLHSITCFNQPQQTNPFIRKYIFPGADVPTLSEIMEPVQRSGLFVTDVEILRLHYAETLRHWGNRFRRRRAEIVKLLGEAFYRKWEFYLIGCEMSFRYAFLMVTQIQLAKNVKAVPLTRDYMYEWEKFHVKGGALKKNQVALLTQRRIR